MLTLAYWMATIVGMKIQRIILVGVAVWFGMNASVQAATHFETFLKQKTVEYKDGDTVLEGVLVFDAAATNSPAKRPGVIVVPDWMGVSQFAIERAVKLTGMGYVAFVADIYGKGVRPANPQEAGMQAGKYKKNRPLLRSRVNAALAVLRDEPQCDAGRLAAIGYCFGGTTVLELARSGAPVVGVVSFHGGLDSPTPADAKNIRGKVLVLHGADDPLVPAVDVAAFQEEMRAANVNWQFTAYGGAVHSFTNPQAGHDPAKGVAYNEQADRRSWQAMTTFLRELFPEQ